VSRYIGAGEKSPALSRLGTQEWNRTRQRVKESVAEIAHDLLQLYAAREVLPGFAFSPDTVWQKELEASFPYIETPDQVKVQEEVKADMERARPMDRLVVGDVGYGKTEIAIRAAFKAVMDNKQVAVLVPTTILAEQHFVTFKQRMAAFPVRIDILSRFRKPAEQKKVLEGIANGSIDICIGTHRLLQKDVVFKDLGLLIIDEEQRFGVAHKEYLKKMQQKVDVLTLSATPIPRTLHMSLIGVRDMSVIETPPENRLPVKTYVAEYSDQIVKDAILREIERGGQVFFVHNRVQGSAAIATRLQNLLPEVKIDVAHGQLPEDKLEQVMLRFQNGETNVLVCTTIIESGLDMPNVNTLIVNQADRFGLTQLYQLRGRIGRGSNSAYAYFLYNKNKKLTDAARKRLQTIFEATELGAGFGIALKDLEIRCAVVLLGTQQSGNISAVGFNLYTQLLAEAIEEQKSRLSGEEKTSRKVILSPPSIDLPLKAYIPDSYVPDLEMRLHLYQKLSQVSSLEGIKELKSELEDRFGLIPPEVDNLLYVLKLKALGLKARIESISTSDSVITLRLHQGEQFSRGIINAISALGIKAGIAQVIINLNSSRENWQKLLERVLYLAGK
jgi:transcription-repair coupling factor (superfamily II helicase)